MTIESDEILQPLEVLLAKFLQLLPGLIAGIVIFIVTLYVSKLAMRYVQKTLARRQVDTEVTILLSKITYWALIVLGVTVSLQQVGFDLTAFLAGLGIVGFTIGFALQDVSKNFIAGMLLLLQQPFDIGEAIEVAGFAGTIEAIELRATELRLSDGRLVIIPNATVFTNPITNFSRAANRRVELKIGVAYESNPDDVRRTALQAIASIPGMLEEPAPQVIFDNFGGSTFDLTLYYWFDTEQTSFSAAKDAGLVLVKEAFEGKGIEMPFPTQTLLLQQAS